MFLVNIPIRKDNVIYPPVYTGFSLLAKGINGLTKTTLAFLDIEQHGQFLGMETLITDVAQDI